VEEEATEGDLAGATEGDLAGAKAAVGVACCKVAVM